MRYIWRMRQALARKIAPEICTRRVSETLARVRSLGVLPATVIDVGASDGRWSRMVMRIFPRATCLMIEAQRIHLPGLGKAAAELGGRYVLAVAGEAVGELYFDTADPFGGVASVEPRPGWERLKADSVDRLSAGLPGPFLLKLDTHGFELPILRGARATLKDTAAVVVEAYNFYLNSEEAVPFWRLCDTLEDMGFRCYDACEPMHRPRDGVLWQMDLVFLPRESPVFQDNNYRSAADPPARRPRA